MIPPWTSEPLAEGDGVVADGCELEPAGIGAPLIIPMGPEGILPPAKSDLMAGRPARGS